MARAFFKDTIRTSSAVQKIFGRPGWQLWNGENLGSQNGRLFLETYTPLPPELAEHLDYYSVRETVTSDMSPVPHMGTYKHEGITGTVAIAKGFMYVEVRGPDLEAIDKFAWQIVRHEVKPIEDRTTPLIPRTPSSRPDKLWVRSVTFNPKVSIPHVDLYMARSGSADGTDCIFYLQESDLVDIFQRISLRRVVWEVFKRKFQQMLGRR